MLLQSIVHWLVPTAYATSSLASLPDASTLLTDVGAYSSPIVTDLMPFVYFSVGIFLGFAILTFLIITVVKAAKHFIHH